MLEDARGRSRESRSLQTHLVELLAKDHVSLHFVVENKKVKIILCQAGRERVDDVHVLV